MWPIKDQPHDKSPLSLPAVNRRGFPGDWVKFEDFGIREELEPFFDGMLI
jgi:hypothetical protein